MSSTSLFISQSVQGGFWRDYESNRTYILVPEYRATLFSTLIALILTLSLFWVDKLVRRLLLHFVRWLSAPERHDGRDIELQPLNESRPPPSFLHNSISLDPHQDVLVLLQMPGGGREMLQGIIHRLREKGLRPNIVSVFVGLFILTTWVSGVVAGVYAANIITDRQALWQSSRCGIWEFDSEGAGDEAATRSDVHQREKEARAGEYARYCYEESATSGQQPSQSLCDFFSQQNITYTKTLSYDCPFANKVICVAGIQSVTFDTGLVDASRIGINDETTYKFRRSATCAPLNTGYPFVQNKTSRGTVTFSYHYGELQGWGRIISNSTFTTTNHPFDTRIPAYDLRTQTTSWDRKYDVWKPIPELTPPENTTITIFLVSPLHIYYLKPSADPIFGVGEKCYIGSYELPFYCPKSDPKARLFACIDKTELCSPSGETCWSMNDEDGAKASGAASSPAYWLMKLSLYSSSMYDSIVWRLGSALLAQERVSQFISTPLPDTHWAAEVERIFANSLARIQFDAWGIASGVDRQHEGQDGYVEYTPKEAGNMCGLYKFKSTGYRNVDAAAFFSLLFVVPFSLWALTRTLGGLYDTGRFIRSLFKNTTSDTASTAPGDEEATLATAGRHVEGLDAGPYDNEAGWGNDLGESASELSEEGARRTLGSPNALPRGGIQLVPGKKESNWDTEELLFCWLFSQPFLGLHWLWRKLSSS